MIKRKNNNNILINRVLNEMNRLGSEDWLYEKKSPTEIAKEKGLERTSPGSKYWKKGGITTHKIEDGTLKQLTSGERKEFTDKNKPNNKTDKKEPRRFNNIKQGTRQKRNIEKEAEQGWTKYHLIGGRNVYLPRNNASYNIRLMTLLNNKSFKEGKAGVYFADAMDALHSNNLDEAEKAFAALKGEGFNIECFNKSGVGMEIRIGGFPMYNFKSDLPKDASTEQQDNALIELYGQLKEIGIEPSSKKSDSKDWKVQSFLKGLDSTKILANEKGIADNQRKTEFFNLGKGLDARDRFANNIKETTADTEGSNFDEEEIEGALRYSQVLSDPSSTKTDIANAFSALCSSSKNRSNEVLKNFGELHAAMLLTYEYPDAILLLPNVGNYPVADIVIKMPGTHGSDSYLVDVAVKAKSDGVPSSAPLVLNTLIPKEDATPRTKNILKAIYKASNKKTMNSIDDNSDESRELKSSLIETLRINSDILDNPRFTLLNSEAKQNLRFDKNKLENNSIEDLINLFAKNCYLLTQIYDRELKDSYDWSATSKHIKSAQVDMTGEMLVHGVGEDNVAISSSKRPGQNCTVYIAKNTN